MNFLKYQCTTYWYINLLIFQLIIYWFINLLINSFINLLAFHLVFFNIFFIIDQLINIADNWYIGLSNLVYNDFEGVQCDALEDH